MDTRMIRVPRGNDDDATRRTVMSDVFANPAVQAGGAVLVLCILIAGAFYLLSSFRDYTAEDREDAPDPLAKLREMHRKGDISEEEFRTIQATAQRKTTESQTADPSASQAEQPPNS